MRPQRLSGNSLVEDGDLAEAIFKRFAEATSEPSLRYHRQSDGDDHYAIAEEANFAEVKAIRGLFGVKRNKNLPQLENESGQYEDLPLKDGEGLAELSHFVYFPKSAVIGIEYNHYAPRIGKLSGYIENKIHDCDRIDFDPIIRNDALERLTNLTEVIELTLVVAGDRVAEINKTSPPLGKIFRALKSGGPNTTQLTASWKFDGRTSDPDKRQLTKLRNGVIKIMRESGADKFEKGIVRGRTGDSPAIDQIDLVSEAMGFKVGVASAAGNSRVADRASVYAAIESTYRENLRPIMEPDAD